MKKIIVACFKGLMFVLTIYLLLIVFSVQLDYSKYGIDLMGIWKDSYFALFLLVALFSYVHSFPKVNIDREFIQVQKKEAYDRLSDSEKHEVNCMGFIERETFLHQRVQDILLKEGESAFDDLKMPYEEKAKKWNRKLSISRLLCNIAVAAGLIFSLNMPIQATANLYDQIEEERTFLQEKVADQTLYLDGYPPIVLMGNGQFTNGDVRCIVDEILPSQPKGLIVLPSRIVFMNDEVWAQQGNEDQYCGFAHSADYSIEVRLNHYSDQNTVTHECAHILDFMYGYSSNPVMLAFYEENPEIVREYGGTNPVEFFAVGSEAYFWNQGDIDQNSPYFQYLKGVFAPFE